MKKIDIGALSPYYKTDDAMLFLGDSFSVLEKLEPESIDMVFADSPYFLSNDGITCHAGRMVPVILSVDGEPVSAGRLDLVIEKIGEDGVLNGERGIADIKRTSTLDKEYLAYQLNLYRIAYQQCYGMKIDFLKGIHLREEKRKYVDIPINEEMAMELVKEYMKGQ